MTNSKPGRKPLSSFGLCVLPGTHMSLTDQLPWRAGVCERGQHAPEVDGAGQLNWGRISHPLSTRQLSPLLQRWDPGQGLEQKGEAVGGPRVWAENGGRGEDAWLSQILKR